MIVRQHEEWKIWNGCHPSQFHCQQNPHKSYSVTDGNVCEFFDDWQSAEAYFMEKTGERSLGEFLIKKI